MIIELRVDNWVALFRGMTKAVKLVISKPG